MAREQPELSDIRCCPVCKGTAERRWPSVTAVLSCAIRPSVTMAQHRHFGNDRAEELAAGVDLGRLRLVLWRYATHRVGTTSIDQL
jgi:hypothetical protein